MEIDLLIHYSQWLEPGLLYFYLIADGVMMSRPRDQMLPCQKERENCTIIYCGSHKKGSQSTHQKEKLLQYTINLL